MREGIVLHAAAGKKDEKVAHHKDSFSPTGMRVDGPSLIELLIRDSD